MRHTLTALRSAARNIGSSVYSLDTETRDTVALVGFNADNLDAKTWFATALPESAKIYNLTAQSARDLADARREIYEIFSLTPKELCDCMAATELLLKLKRRKPERAKQLFYLSDYSGYAAFGAFISRVFEMTTKELLASPAAAEKKLKQRFPKLAPALLENADAIFNKNESTLFLVVIQEKTEPQNRTTKPNHKTEPQNGRKILLTKRGGGDRLAE